MKKTKEKIKFTKNKEIDNLKLYCCRKVKFTPANFVRYKQVVWKKYLRKKYQAWENILLHFYQKKGKRKYFTAA